MNELHPDTEKSITKTVCDIHHLYHSHHCAKKNSFQDRTRCRTRCALKLLPHCVTDGRSIPFNSRVYSEEMWVNSREHHVRPVCK